jgi:hypothetical protein
MSLPEIKHCLICEDVRLERRNLNSFMGVYGATPDVGIRIRNFELPVVFCFVFMGAAAQGKFVVEAELRNPNGARISSEIEPKGFEFNFSLGDLGSILAFRIKATFAGPDTYSIVLLNNATVFFKDTFQLRQGKSTDFS